MTGYQEVLTDPSYRGQVVAMTYPQIGNYGVNPEDAESSQVHVRGFVIGELCPVPSNFRSTQSLHDYLAEAGVPGIEDVDTRALTKHLRSAGAMQSCSDWVERKLDGTGQSSPITKPRTWGWELSASSGLTP